MGVEKTREVGDTVAPEAAERPWYGLEADEVARILSTSPAGLSSAEAAERLRRYGPNEIEREAEEPWWQTLLRQFASPLIYILLIAAVITIILRDYSDTLVILVAVLLDVLIAYTQERKAQASLRALEQLSAPRCDVVREGVPRNIATRELVPGDVVVLTSGTRIPADLRIFRVQDLHIDESALTGESQHVAKTTGALGGERRVPGDQFNMAFAGTVVTRGRGWGYAVRTGANTELGRIATAIRRVGTTATPLQEKMERLAKQIGVSIVVLCALIGLVGLFRGMPLGEVLLVSIALVVSAIPESLPVVLTITFAVGVRRMARRNALVRLLPAVETLGSATVIGSDKTGTLTQNQMTVERIWAGGAGYRVTGIGYAPEGEIVADDDARVVAVSEGRVPGDGERLPAPLYATLVTGCLANEADAAFLDGSPPVGDPTELALIVAAAKGGVDARRLREEFHQLDLLPFESERRYMATLAEGPHGRTIYLKGAPEMVVSLCDRQLGPAGEMPIDPAAIGRAADDMAGLGLRVLAMAYRRHDAVRFDDLDVAAGGFVFAGLQGMRDPVRPEAVAAVRDAHTAGIRVIMLTGDHAATAAAVGSELGLDPTGAGAVEGSELDALDDAELDERLSRVNIFARVAPEHKLRIVERLKAHGHTVAVTGDGVNDAPALRAAHLGIAMGRGGTDVAREASDLVLADDNFATITAAIEEGRVVFANVRKVIFFLLSTTAGDILAIVAALLVGWPIPFNAAQILWVNLVTNGLQDIALAVEPPERGLLHRKPRPRGENVVTWRVFERFFVVGVVLAAGSLGMYWWTLETTGDVDLARTVAMTQIVVFNFYHVFNCRSLDTSLFEIPFFSNRFLFYTVVGAAVAQLAVLHVPVLQTIFRTQPLDLETWAIMLLIGTTVILGGELDKWRNRRRGMPIG